MMNWRSSWTLNLVVSITTSASRRIGAMRRRSSRMPSAMEPPCAKRMRAAGFAEAADQRLVARFDEHQGHGMLAAQLAIHLRQILDLLAFAGIHEQRGTLDFASSAFVKLAEGGNQRYGKIIHAVEAEVFEGIEYRTLTRTGQSGEQHELAPVALSGGSRHGGPAC